MRSLGSKDISWFTPKAAATLVLFLYLINWLFILLVGKRRFLAMQAQPSWFTYLHGRPQAQPYILLAAFVLNALLLYWFLATSSGRKLKVSYARHFRRWRIEKNVPKSFLLPSK